MKNPVILFFLLFFSHAAIIAQPNHLAFGKPLEEMTWKEIDSLSNKYFYAGFYETALEISNFALQKCESENGIGSTKCLMRWNNIGMVYQSMGKYEKAIPLVEYAMKLALTQFGGKSPDYFILQNNLALLYSNIRLYERAIELSLESLVYTKDIMGIDHPKSKHILVLCNLGIFYNEIGDLENAFIYASEAVKAAREKLGESHYFYGQCLNNLAIVYKSKKDYQKGLELFEEAFRVFKISPGENHPLYSAALANIAQMHLKLGDLDLALSLTLASLENREKVLGKEHPKYGMLLELLVDLYEEKGMLNECAETFKLLTENANGQIYIQFPNFSEEEEANLIEPIQKSFNKIQSFTFRNPEIFHLEEICYNNLLSSKGLLLGDRKRMLNAVRASENPEIKEKFAEWDKVSQFLAWQYQLPEAKRSPEFDSIRIFANDIERDLARISNEFKDAKTNATWEQIANQLKKDEAAIEFTHFPYIRNGQGTDSTFYCAYILRNGYSAPEMIFLFEEKELEKLLQEPANQDHKSTEQLYASRGFVPSQAPSQPGKDLYQLVWQPIDTFFSGVNRIYFSPSGFLTRINFSAIPFNKSKVLADLYDFNQLGSTRQLISKNTSATTSKDAILFGGIQYEKEKNLNSPDSLHSLFQQSSINKEDGLYLSFQSRGGKFDYLEGTLQEVHSIKEELSRSGFKAEVKEGILATEESFKQIGENAPSPQIIHLATHGYFFHDSESRGMHNGLAISEHPMIRSGLLLAGANTAWEGNPPPPGQEDGILTAYEISQMNLTNTELVVLSACETGLGDIQGNEGVFGLQRAFKIAGVQYLIMSLWQVPDKETQEFMTLFYDEWLGGKTIHMAFGDTQKTMRKRFPKEPFKWAGFILME